MMAFELQHKTRSLHLFMQLFSLSSCPTADHHLSITTCPHSFPTLDSPCPLCVFTPGSPSLPLSYILHLVVISACNNTQPDSFPTQLQPYVSWWIWRQFTSLRLTHLPFPPPPPWFSPVHCVKMGRKIVFVCDSDSLQAVCLSEEFSSAFLVC